MVSLTIGLYVKENAIGLYTKTHVSPFREKRNQLKVYDNK